MMLKQKNRTENRRKQKKILTARSKYLSKCPSKYLLILLLAASLILTTGCGMGGKFFRGSGQEIESYDFRRGTEGVTMQFVRGMPPETMYAGTQFSIGLKLKNNGAYNIKDRAEIKISVPDTEAFEFSQGTLQQFSLEGKSLYVKEGQEEIVSFPAKSICIPYGSFRKNYSAKIQAISCYYYETTAQADICVDTQFYRRQGGQKGACEMREISMSGGQGGPVGVTKIPQPQIIEKGGEKVTVQISIPMKNLKQRGVSIFNPNTPCNEVKKMNEVEFEVSLAGKPMQCRPSKLLKLQEAKENAIVCTVDMDPNRGAFTTPISVKMKYYVLQKAMKQIHVQPPPEGGEAVDCQKMKESAEEGGSSRCSESFEGHTCRDVSSQCPGGDSTCITNLGCKQGYCPGGATNVCCPANV